MNDLEKTVGDGEGGPLEDRSQIGPSGIRSGCAISSRYYRSRRMPAAGDDTRGVMVIWRQAARSR